MMHRKVFILSIGVLLIAGLSLGYAEDLENEGNERERNVSRSTTHSTTHKFTDSTTHSTTRSTTRSTTHMSTKTTSRRSTKRTSRYDDSYESDKPYRNGKDRQGYGRYNDDSDEYERNRGYDNDDYAVTGQDGIDPRKYGQDKADFGPIYDNQESMYASMDVWISAADDWESNHKSKYRNNYPGKKYNKGKNYKDRDNKDRNYKDRDNKDRNYKDRDNKDRNYKDRDNKDRNYKDRDNKDRNYKDRDNKDRNYKEKDYNDRDDKDNDYKDNDYKKNDRKKRSYSRVHFPVRQYKDIRRFPTRRFPPLISILPWLPIFYDKITYQTLIFSPTGGIYILPPLINFYGQRFAVAQLIKWGYASLVSSGAPPPPNINVAPLVQPAPVGGVVAAGVVGGAAAGPAPTFDTNRNRFNGGVKTDFPDFKPRYGKTIEDRSYGNNRPSNRNNYGSDSNYGGTGRQEVYAQGGPRSGGYN